MRAVLFSLLLSTSAFAGDLPLFTDSVSAAVMAEPADKAAFEADWKVGVAHNHAFADQGPWLGVKKAAPVVGTLHGLTDGLQDVLRGVRLEYIDKAAANGVQVNDRIVRDGFTAEIADAGGLRPTGLWFRTTETSDFSKNKGWHFVEYNDDKAVRIWSHIDVATTISGSTDRGVFRHIVDLTWDGKTLASYRVRSDLNGGLQSTTWTPR